MIEITAIPTGEAPESVRQAFVGLNLPGKLQEKGQEVWGVLTGSKDTENQGGYNVHQVDVLTALENGDQQGQDVALWWKTRYPIPDGLMLAFGLQCCKVVD